jgi:putative membrane protein
MLVFFSLYSWGVIYLEIEYLKLTTNSHASHITVMHSLLGFALSILLVFRTNTAYDRWWEGRRLWGQLVNASRNLALKYHAFLNEKSDLDFFEQCIPIFSKSLANHLQKSDIAIGENISEQLRHEVSKKNHQPLRVAELLFNKTNNLYQNKQLTNEQFLNLNADLTALMDICGGCERIKNTPIPYSYSTYIKKFIFIYVATLPFGFAFTLEYLAIPVTAFIFYVLASLEIIAEEIEDPFGSDANDLPTDDIAIQIRTLTKEICAD